MLAISKRSGLKIQNLKTQTRVFSHVQSSTFDAQFQGLPIQTINTGSELATVSIVVKAGSRYQTSSGLSHFLNRFAFQNSHSKLSSNKWSGLRTTRISEILGGSLKSTFDRETVTYTAQFPVNSINYFFENFYDSVLNPNFDNFEIPEIVAPLVNLDIKKQLNNPIFIALEGLHSAVYRHQGLGAPLLFNPKTDTVSSEALKDFHKKVFTPSSLFIAATDISPSSLTSVAKSSGFTFTTDSHSHSSSSSSSSVKTFSGEYRNVSNAGSVAVIGFPVSSSPEAAVVATALGDSSIEPSIKWSNGLSKLAELNKSPTNLSAGFLPYEGSGLLYVAVSSPNVTDAASEAVSSSLLNIVQSLKSLSFTDEELKRAIAKVKLNSALKSELSTNITSQAAKKALNIPTLTPSSFSKVTPASTRSFLSDLKSVKPSLSVVGNQHRLPYLEELGF